jgi:tRNA threonylcarbamoyladenosine biosynthesis protein TsaB
MQMSFILNIDTASERAHVSFAKEGLVIQALYSESQKKHASFLQTAIEQLTKLTGIKLTEIDAITVTAGPGSYTGLRVGMASAKGLCYALQKPLITLNTLEVLAASAINFFPNYKNEFLFCPMMDARRMEIFTAIYNSDLKILLTPFAMILNESSFKNELANNKILFFGSGSAKWKPVCDHTNAAFENVQILPEALARLSFSLLSKNHFTDLVYSEPIYLKDFQTVNRI